MKLLALDTSTEACSAALWIDGEIRQYHQMAAREHSQLILDMMDKLLAETCVNLTQMDAVAFGRGPGSFVGVRIATGVVQGMAFAHDLPVVPVSSLAALAHASGHTHNAVAIDARMQEVYWAHYVKSPQGELMLQSGEGVCPPHQVPVPAVQGENWVGVGSGWQTYSRELSQRLSVQQWQGEAYPRAASIAALAVIEVNKGNVVSAEQALPSYLRDQVAKKPLAK